MNPPYHHHQYNGYHHGRGTTTPGGNHQLYQEEEQQRHARARLPAAGLGVGVVVPLPPPPPRNNRNNFNLGNILKKTEHRSDPHHHQGVVFASRNDGGVGRVVHRSPHQIPHRHNGGRFTKSPKHRMPRMRQQQHQTKKRSSSPYNEYARKTAYALQRPAYVNFPSTYCDLGSP
jgi:hypothetical protein